MLSFNPAAKKMGMPIAFLPKLLGRIIDNRLGTRLGAQHAQHAHTLPYPSRARREPVTKTSLPLKIPLTAKFCCSPFIIRPLIYILAPPNGVPMKEHEKPL